MKARKGKEGLPADLEDDVDLFHKGKEKISLNNGNEEVSNEDLSEEDIDVYNLGESDEEESDSEDEGRLADRAALNSDCIHSHLRKCYGLQSECDAQLQK